jgi:hypothetical protein
VAPRAPLLEGAAVGAAGAALGALALRPFGLAPAGAIVAGVNGIVSGWRGVYDFRRANGWLAAGLDSTWGMVGTAGGLLVHALSILRRDPGYVPDLSARRGRHVYQRGWQPRRGFAFTAGNVITGAGDTTRERRRELVERHETVHVWQQRGFGPLFPLLYGGWMLGGVMSGSIAWAWRRQLPWFRVVERHAYYYNPFERWAYVADRNWPPRALSGERVPTRGPGAP